MGCYFWWLLTELRGISYLNEKVNVLKTRKIEFDYLRIISMFLVVVCHSLIVVYPYYVGVGSKAQNFDTLNNFDKVFSSIMAAGGRLGVPFFFLLSGYFLISKFQLTETGISTFYRKHFLRLLLTFELWMILYEFFVRGYLRIRAGLLQIIMELLFVAKEPNYSNQLGSAMIQMWFIPVILGIYLFMPLLVTLVKNIPSRFKTWLVLAAVGFDFVIPTANALFQFWGKNVTVNSNIDYAFLGSSYGVYVLIGGLIQEGWLSKFSNWLLWFSAITGGVLSVLMQLMGNILMGHYYFIWYDNLFILITTVAIFELINRIKGKKTKTSKAIVLLSGFSLGIYLIHYPIQLLIRKYLFLTNVNMINFAANLLATYLLSLIVVYLLSKIKFFRMYLFYEK